MHRIAFGVTILLLGSACGNHEAGPTATSMSGPTATPTPPAADQAPTAPATVTAPAAAVRGSVAEFKVATTGATMTFDVTKMEVTAGQTVHVVFTNKTPGTLGHNWVLLRLGKEASFAASVLDKPGYFADGPDVLAHTELITPGKSAEVTFTAPSETGNYPYICSFPGHYTMMKGVLVVKAP